MKLPGQFRRNDKKDKEQEEMPDPRGAFLTEGAPDLLYFKLNIANLAGPVERYDVFDWPGVDLKGVYSTGEGRGLDAY